MPLSQIPRAREGALFSMNPVLSAAISAARRGLFTWAGHQRALFEEETLPVIWLLTREKNSTPPLVLLPCLCHQVPWICDKQTFGVLSPLGRCRCPQLASFNLGQASPAPACACRGRRERSLALLLQNELWKIKSRGKRGEKKKDSKNSGFPQVGCCDPVPPSYVLTVTQRRDAPSGWKRRLSPRCCDPRAVPTRPSCTQQQSASTRVPAAGLPYHPQYCYAHCQATVHTAVPPCCWVPGTHSPAPWDTMAGELRWFSFFKTSLGLKNESLACTFCINTW